MIPGVARVLLLLPTGTYKAPDFLAAAARLDVDVVVASDTEQTLAEAMGDRALVVDLARRERTRGPKWLWALIILFVSGLGPIAYFLLGRQE